MMVVKVVSALLLLMLGSAVLAGPDDSIITTYADGGQHQIDFKFGSVRESQQTRQSGATLGIGTAFTEQWFSEVYVGYAAEGGGAFHTDALSWINTLLLTQGQYPFDLGVYTEIEYPQQRSEGYVLAFGPLLQTEIGWTKVNLNFLFERNYRADVSSCMQFGYQWQARHRWRPGVELGLQGFGEIGQWNHWAPRSEQSHRIGPAIFGKVTFNEQQVIQYNAALLLNVGAKHGTSLRAQIVYGF